MIYITIEYKGVYGSKDKSVTALAHRYGGRATGASGFFFPTSLRDLEFSFRDVKKANLFCRAIRSRRMRTYKE